MTKLHLIHSQKEEDVQIMVEMRPISDSMFLVVFSVLSLIDLALMAWIINIALS